MLDYTYFVSFIFSLLEQCRHHLVGPRHMCGHQLVAHIMIVIIHRMIVIIHIMIVMMHIMIVMIHIMIVIIHIMIVMIHIMIVIIRMCGHQLVALMAQTAIRGTLLQYSRFLPCSKH